MSGFSKDWLALRESADRRARNPQLSTMLSDAFAGRESLRIIDLGAGSGNNMVATSAHLPRAQHWILADNDTALLDHAQTRVPTGMTAEARMIDLAAGVGPLLAEKPDLVTASALFDLCGVEWVEAFADALVRSGAALYAVLSYDGRERWTPECPHDADVLRAFHNDQRTDKGMGESLGPGAHSYLAAVLAERGYRTSEGQSDWELTRAEDSALIAALAEGTVNAVSGALDLMAANEWYAARRNADTVRIGHHDLLALPPG